MGHRADFVLIRDGKAAAYSDQWAALGSTYSFAGGPDQAVLAAEAAEPAEELLDWAFAEAGYLIDFDEKVALVFGYPEPLDFDPEEAEGFDNDGLAEAGAIDAALQVGAGEFLKTIAPKWAGWLLKWDERGVDAFAEHLAKRGIHSITTQPPSHPPESEVVSHQA